ncbi:MAG: ABC transporter permease subunit [Chlamydia sp.]
MNEHSHRADFRISQAFFPLFLFLTVWESAFLVYRWYVGIEETDLFSTVILPSPSQIILESMHRWSLLWPHLMATLCGIVGSLLIALSISIPLGFLMISSKKISLLFQTAFLLFKSVPSFSFAPILIICTGWGLFSSFFPAILAGIIPITMSIFAGVQEEMHRSIEYFESMNATTFQRFFLLYLPSMRLSLFSGFRIAITGAGMANLASEWCGAKKGLGILLMDMREQMDITMMFVCIASLSAITGCIYLVTYCIELLVQPGMRRFWRKRAICGN